MPKPSTPAGQVVVAVKRFQTATLNRDANAYCDQLTSAAKEDSISRGVVIGSQFDCPAAVEKAFTISGKDTFENVRQSRARLRPSDVRVKGRRATVTMPVSHHKFGLRKVAGEWLIDKLP
jgi:hypothetical protein